MTKGFSYSILTTALRCNQLYKYIYLDKLVIEGGQESGAAKFGTAIHLGVEDIISLGTDGLGTFNAFWDAEKTQNNSYGRFTWESLRTQGEIMLTRFKSLHAYKFKFYQMEQRLYSNIEGINFEGTPDFIGDFLGTPSIVDFKTSSMRYSRDKIKTAEQLVLYAHMVEKELKYTPKQIVYCVFVKGKVPDIHLLTAPLTPEWTQSVVSNFVNIAKDLVAKEQTGVFTQTRSNCLSMFGEPCPFFSKCYK